MKSWEERLRWEKEKGWKERAAAGTEEIEKESKQPTAVRHTFFSNGGFSQYIIDNISM